MFGPFKYTSPVSPTPTGSNCGFKIRTEIPGNGNPTLPGLRSPVYGLLMFISVSLIP